ncbi:MAG TPA: hypothetical protein VFD96_02030, partial [Burkholderiaceae bacterium]|nr:hypothetical protein [Burkholderiaceae bacterium]
MTSRIFKFGKTVIASAIVALSFSATPALAQDKTVNIKIAGMFGSNFQPIGKHVNEMTKNVALATNNTVRMRFYEPGALVPVLGIFDAVSAGSVEAGHVGIGLYINKEPGLALFNAAPFTP